MKHWEPAPNNSSHVVSGAMLGVSLNPGERVEWAYTILPDGQRIATGYDILPPKIQKRLKNKLFRVVKK